MKTELWKGHKIRFVEINNEWWAVAKDIAEALDYAETRTMTKRLKQKYLMSTVLVGMNAKSSLLSEFGIYKAILGSHKPEAEEFEDWIFNIIKELRQSTGLEGFQVFRMLDKEHQKEAMNRISRAFKGNIKIDCIKANSIANKAVSNKYGFPKMIKKGDMTPGMMADRQPILEEVTDLMIMREKYGLDFSVSEKIYNRLSETQTA